nr:gal repressor - Salmonella typhimurium [Salmonella enterica subsp. enterica serovar Typhimurium]
MLRVRRALSSSLMVRNAALPEQSLLPYSRLLLPDASGYAV